MNENDLERLIDMAVDARSNAYAPYSVYSVGAAVLAGDGALFGGCNVENASYGLTICAERNAIAAMVAAGRQEIFAVAVATEDGGTPCGACLQVIAEFASKNGVTVVCVDGSGNRAVYDLNGLAPHLFKPSAK